MNRDEYKRVYGARDDAAPGWEAIDSRLRPIYGEQEPRHWGTIIKHMLGGPDPLDGISAYECRDIFESGKWFANYHWIPANGPIHLDSDTEIVGLAFVDDPTLEPVDSPHGRVEFIQAFGLTQHEIDALKAKTRSCADIVEQHRASNPLLITDLDRKNQPA